MRLVEEVNMDEKSPFAAVEAANYRAAGKGKRKSGQRSKFMAKAKKFAKQGRLGRGFEIDKDTYDYFLRVLELSQKNEFEAEEDRESFIINSFTQTEGNEVNYSSNQMLSRVLESLLPSANEEILIRFTSAFSQSLRTICPDPFASHVLEKLLEVTSSDKWVDSTPLNEWFRQTSQYILNNFEEFTFDNYANHAMRKVCQCLSGSVTPSGQGKTAGKGGGPAGHQDSLAIFGERKKNPKREEMLTNFYKRFIAWPQFFDLFKKELTCGLVQSLLKTYHRLDSEGVQDGVSKTIKALGDVLDLSQSVVANLYTRTVEVCLTLSNKPQWMSIYSKYFKDDLVNVGLHEKGFFCVKKLIETCPNKEMFETLYEELEPVFNQFYQKKYTSIFVTIAEGCKKFQSKQHPFIMSISSLTENEASEDASSKKSKLTSSDHSNFILLVAKFGQQSPMKEDGTPLFLTDISGTMVLQNMMEFHKPLKVISSLIEMDENDLVKLTIDPKGSHILDSFFKSLTIGDKNKDKVLNKLSESMSTLGTNKFGSRVIDTMWAWADNKRKGTIAAALCSFITQLAANQYGKFLCEKLALRAYKHNSTEWLHGLNKGNKKEKEMSLLADELGLEKPTSQRKKTKQPINEEANENSESIINEDATEDSSGERSERKKNKKNKPANIILEPNSDSNVNENGTEEDSAERSERKKKKKNKRQDEGQNESSLVDETTERKKKRKKEKGENTIEEMETTLEETDKHDSESCVVTEMSKADKKAKKNKRRLDMNDSEIQEQGTDKKKKKQKMGTST